MIKEIIKGIILGTVLSLAFAPLIVHAETPQERWIRIQKEDNEKFMNKVEEDGNLTQEAIDALAWGDKSKKTNKKSDKETEKNPMQGYYYDQDAKGGIYSTDELHVVGLPENPETGYTQSGIYGIIP